MLNKECADGDYAEKRVQFTPEEGVSLSGAERLNALRQLWRGRMVGSGHRVAAPELLRAGYGIWLCGQRTGLKDRIAP